MPQRSLDYLHGHHDSVLRSHRWRTAENSAGYLLPRLARDARVLDVGCGPGTITVGLAAHAAEGQITGVDAAGDVLDGARAAAREAGQANVSFQAGDVYRLEFADDSFDVVHAHQLLHHLSDPVAALAEMRRVCRPGGLVAVRDADYGGMVWYPAEPGLTEWQRLYHEVARATGGEPDAGRHLLHWVTAAGFTQPEPTASAWCYAGPEVGAWWAQSWAERATGSNFARQATSLGLARPADLDALADAWLRWGASPDCSFLIPHGEVLATV
jgi:ubiquinone/menaquinone biosynthesis C-methylase UbiE